MLTNTDTLGKNDKLQNIGKVVEKISYLCVDDTFLHPFTIVLRKMQRLSNAYTIPASARTISTTTSSTTFQITGPVDLLSNEIPTGALLTLLG